MKYRSFSSCVFIAAILVCVSCREKEDVIMPVISVIEPLAVPVLTVPDSVRVVATVSDNNRLEFIRVGLVNADRIHVTDPVTYYPSSTYMNIDECIPVTDKMFSSGKYYILIHASDGINARNKYLELTINELPREISGFLVLKTNGASRLLAEYLTGSYLPDTTLSLDLGYHASFVDPFHERFYLITPFPSSVWSFPLREPEPDWGAYAAMPAPSYTGVFLDNELILGTENGDLWIVDHSGHVVANTAPLQGMKVGVIAATSSFVACEVKSLDGNDHFLKTYYRKTAGLSTDRKICCDVASILPAGNNFIVACNEEDNIAFYSLDPEEGGMTLLKTVGFQNLRMACPGPADQIFYSTGDCIYLYDLAGNSVTSFASKAVNGMCYDPLNSVLFYHIPAGFGIIDYPYGGDIGFYPAGPDVVNFHIIYNR